MFKIFEDVLNLLSKALDSTSDSVYLVTQTLFIVYSLLNILELGAVLIDIEQIQCKRTAVEMAFDTFFLAT